MQYPILIALYINIFWVNNDAAKHASPNILTLQTSCPSRVSLKLHLSPPQLLKSWFDLLALQVRAQIPFSIYHATQISAVGFERARINPDGDHRFRRPPVADLKHKKWAALWIESDRIVNRQCFQGTRGAYFRFIQVHKDGTTRTGTHVKI